MNYDVQVYFDNLPSEEEIDTYFSYEDSNIVNKTLIKYLPSEMTNSRNGKKATGLINGIKIDQDLLQIVDDTGSNYSRKKNIIEKSDRKVITKVR